MRIAAGALLALFIAGAPVYCGAGATAGATAGAETGAETGAEIGTETGAQTDAQTGAEIGAEIDAERGADTGGEISPGGTGGIHGLDESELEYHYAPLPELEPVRQGKDKGHTEHPLIVASRLLRYESVRAAIEEGYEVNAFDEDRRTALMWVSTHRGRAQGQAMNSFSEQEHAYLNGKSGAIAKLLLHHGASITFQDSFGMNSVHFAAASGNAATMGVLLMSAESKAVNAQDVNGSTPLMIAAKNGHAASTKLLLEWGANAKRRDFNEMRPLGAAIQNGNYDVVRVFLSRPDFDARGRVDMKKKRPPCHVAASVGHVKILELLHSKGLCDFDYTDADGLTAYSLSVKIGHEHAAMALRDMRIEKIKEDHQRWLSESAGTFLRPWERERRKQGP